MMCRLRRQQLRGDRRADRRTCNDDGATGCRAGQDRSHAAGKGAGKDELDRVAQVAELQTHYLEVVAARAVGGSSPPLGTNSLTTVVAMNLATADAPDGAEVHVLVEYFPVLLFLAVATGIGIALLVLGNLFGPKKPGCGETGSVRMRSRRSKTHA